MSYVAITNIYKLTSYDRADTPGDDGAVGEVLGESGGVQHGGHEDELEAAVLGERVAQHDEHEVTQPVALVYLVYDDVSDGGEQ